MMTRHGTRTRAWLAVAVVCGTLVALPVPFDEQSVEADTPGFCQVRLRYYNRNRHVHGPVDTECSWPHTPPWGNWGVESNGGWRLNGFQFAGWKPKDGLLQWNSCTSDNAKYRAPSSRYYNWNGNREQWSGGIRQYGDTGWVLGSTTSSCRAVFEGVYTVPNVYMKLWELDAGWWPFGEDDDVTTLQYGSVSIPVTCSSHSTCTGVSAWRSARDSKVAADVHITLVTRYW